MTYRVTYQVQVGLFQDGGGQIGTNQNGPILELQGVQIVPGANSPTGANLTTACTAMGTDISTQMNVAATLAQIQAFATGGN